MENDGNGQALRKLQELREQRLQERKLQEWRTEKLFELQVAQTAALQETAKAFNAIANFVVNGGLTQLVSNYARGAGANQILGGLASHGGRNSLDARVLGQNAIEIVEAIDLVFKKHAERLSSNEERDPDIHVAVEPKPEDKQSGD